LSPTHLCEAPTSSEISVTPRKEPNAVDEGNDFMELMEIQGNLDLVTKSELLDEVRRHGARMTDRQLTSLVTEGLVPKSARIGSKGGAYPRIVVDLLTFISRSRSRGLSVQAIRELLPVWRYLRRAVRTREVSLAELEYIARQSVTLTEAVFAVPSMLQEALPCPFCQRDELDGIKFIAKDGRPLDAPVTVGFVIAQTDEDTGRTVRRAVLRIAIPLGDEGDNPTSLILGIPNGVPLSTETTEPVSLRSPAQASATPVHRETADRP
jgi:DNA-binding transcriptional MerR regulator